LFVQPEDVSFHKLTYQEHSGKITGHEDYPLAIHNPNPHNFPVPKGDENSYLTDTALMVIKKIAPSGWKNIECIFKYTAEQNQPVPFHLTDQHVNFDGAILTIEKFGQSVSSQ
jgi:hypothetical protein